METRTVFIIATQLRLDVTAVPESALTDDNEMEKWLDHFQPHYQIATTRKQLDAVIRNINKHAIYNHCFTEIQVNTYALPDKIQFSIPAKRKSE